MKTKSSKAKGKRLEQWLCDTLMELFNFTSEDIRITIGQENGADIKLSKVAQKQFPYVLEAKNRQTFTTLYGFYRQATKHDKTLEPIVIIKMNFHSLKSKMALSLIYVMKRTVLIMPIM